MLKLFFYKSIFQIVLIILLKPFNKFYYELFFYRDNILFIKLISKKKKNLKIKSN